MNGDERSDLILSASEIDYPPFCMLDQNGKPTGFSVELFTEAMKRMGKNVEFKVGAWNEVMQMLNRGDIHALPLVGRTPEREPIFDFTFPYMTLYGAIVVRKEDDKISSIADLENKTVAVMKNDNAEEYLIRKGIKMNLISLPTFKHALTELSAGKYDAVVIQRLVALRLINELGIKNLRIVSSPINDFSQSFCFAVKDGDKDTLSILNEGLSVLFADGTFNHLHSKWFARYELPVNRNIIIGGDRYFPPYEFVNNRGDADGFNVELFKRLSAVKGLNVEFKLADWTDVMDGLRFGKIDIIQGIFYSKKRAEIYDFSKPYMQINYVAVQRKNSFKPIKQISDLKNLHILVEKGDIANEICSLNGFNANLHTVSNMREALIRLADDSSFDCAIVPIATARYMIESEKLKGLKIGVDTLFSADYCFAVRKGDKALLAEFTDALQILEDNGDFHNIRKKWFPPLFWGYSFKHFILVIALLSLSLFLSVLWIKRLRTDVSGKKFELRQLQERYKNVFEGSRDGFVVVDKNGVILDANDAYCNMLGYTLDELKKKNFYEITPEKWHEWERLEIVEKRLFEKEWTDLYEKEYIRKNGEIFPVEIQAGTVRDEKGNISYLWGVVRDISQRKAAEKKLRERLLFEETISKIALYSANEDNISSFIEKALKTLGENINVSRTYLFECDEKTGLFLNTYEWCADGVKPQKEKLQSISRSNFETFFNSINTQSIYKCSDINEVPDLKTREILREQDIKSFIICKVMKGGKFCGFIGCDECRENRNWYPFEEEIMLSVANIFDTIFAKFAAKQEEHRLSVAIEHSPEAVVITNVSGKIRYVNSAFEKITGYKREEVVGQTPRLLKSGKHDENFYRQLWSTIRDKRVWRGQFINKRKDGSLYYEDAVISPVLNSKGEIVDYVAIKRDITDKVNLEKQLQVLQKLEAIGRLAGGVAHDFNNMLSVILGFAELAKDKIDRENSAIADLDEIIKAGNRAADMTKQLLAFARREVSTPKLINVNKEISDNLSLFKNIFGKNIKFSFITDKEELFVMMDPAQLLQVVLNLLINAKDSISGSDGEVVLSTSCRKIEAEDCLKNPEYQQGFFAFISVQDNGCGIEPEILNNVFEPFFTTKAKGKGTGLGLSTVYGIVKQNGGFISVRSEPKKGAKFTVFIPIADKENAPSVVKMLTSSNDNSGTGAKNCVLIVEDEPGILAICKNILEKANFNVIASTSPRKALELARDNRPDILLTDVIMPEMSGKELAKKLLKEYPNCKILYMSGYTADVILEKGVLEEQTNLIRKPFTPDELIRKVNEVIAKE